MLAEELSRHVGRFYGKYRGKVVDNVDPDQQGTLRVMVPDVFGTDTDVPARACMPYGHFFVPPVDADVWVEFEAGDPEYPLWVGAWYPVGKVPAEAKVSPPDHRVIQTPAGHTIEIVDTGGEERILIRHATNAFVSIDPNGSVLLANPNGSHLHLDAEHETATLVEQHGNHLAMGEKGTAVVNPDGTTINVAGDTVHISAANVVLDATSVMVGHGASDPVVSGPAFKELWTRMLTHTHPHPMGPAAASLELALPTAQMVDALHFTASVVT